MRVVLDASAALSAVLGRTEAQSLLKVLEQATIVLAPDLYPAEVANGLWKYVIAREISPDEASVALDRALKLVDRLLAVSEFSQEALREAAVQRHPVYDLCYIIAARREGASVLTLDKKLSKLLAKMNVPAMDR